MQCTQTKNVNAQKMISTGNEVSGLRQGKQDWLRPEMRVAQVY